MSWLEQVRIDCEERSLAGLAWVASRMGRGPELPPHLATGAAGETAALFYLRRKGYLVVAGRWTTGSRRGDLDLVAWQGEMLCFVEVKTRTARDLTPAESAVDAQKRSVIRSLARRYVRQLPGNAPPPVRFDILTVYTIPGKPKEFEHFENAFGWSERRRDG